MKFSNLFRRQAIALLTLCSAPLAAYAGNWVQTPVSGGVVIVNQTSGSITFCSGLLNGNTNQPLGKCAAIGSIAPVNLNGNVQVNAGTTANLVFFVTNTATGAIAQCSMMTNGNTGAPIGTCVGWQAQ